MTKKLLTLSLTTAILIFSGCDSNNSKTQTDIEQKDTQKIDATNKPPIANINTDKTIIQIGEKITFNTKGSSDIDGEIVSFEWLDKDGKTLSTDKTLTQTYKKEGTYTKTLKVTDDKGKSNTKEIDIKVIKKQDQTIPNKPPIAKAQISRTEILVEEGIRFTSNGSKDLDGKIISYEWRDKEGILLSTKAEFSRGFPYPATYTKILTVTDDKGATATDSVTLIVKPKPIPPTADAGEDITITEGESITVDASNSKTENKTITMYRWDIKNKFYCENSKICKIKDLTAGEYILTLTIKDSENQLAADTLNIVVKAKTEILNGYTLPPEPYNVVNNSTLIGIDTNNNGIRDDVERMIIKDYPKKLHTELLLDGAKEFQKIMEQSLGNALDLQKNISKVINCRTYLADIDIDIASYNFNMIKYLENITFNTNDRAKKYLDYNIELSGGVYGSKSSDWSRDKCSENTIKALEEMGL